MQAQAKVQLDDRDARGGQQAPHPLQAPGQQQMMGGPAAYVGGPQSMQQVGPLTPNPPEP